MINKKLAIKFLSLTVITLVICAFIEISFSNSNDYVRLFDDNNYIYLIFAPMGFNFFYNKFKFTSTESTENYKVIFWGTIFTCIFCIIMGFLGAIVTLAADVIAGHTVPLFNVYIMPKIIASAIYGSVFNAVAITYIIMKKDKII
jgi:hypothetical protein